MDREPYFTARDDDLTWNHLQYVQYLIDNFIQQDGGPTWTIGGQTDLIEKMETTIDFAEAGTVAAMLEKLIPVHYGIIDYYVVPTDAGFEFRIFAILDSVSAQTVGFAVPSNPNIVQIIKDKNITLIDTRIVESNERKVDKIEVIGKTDRGVRKSLRGGRSPHNFPDRRAGLIRQRHTGQAFGWSDALETSYKGHAGVMLVTGNPIADADIGTVIFDKVRQREKYRPVYQHFGVPSDWDIDGGKWNVACDDKGNVIQSTDFQDVDSRDAELHLRSRKDSIIRMIRRSITQTAKWSRM